MQLIYNSRSWGWELNNKKENQRNTRHPNGKGVRVSSHTAAKRSILGQAGCLTKCVPLTHLAK